MRLAVGFVFCIGFFLQTTGAQAYASMPNDLSVSQDSSLIAQQQETIRSLQLRLLEQQESNRFQKVWNFVTALIVIYLISFMIVFQRMVRQRRESKKDLLAKTEELEIAHLRMNEAESKLEQSERKVAMNRLAAGLANELSAPVGAIRSNIDLLHQLLDREVRQWGSLAAQLDRADVMAFSALIAESLSAADVTEKQVQKEVEKFFKEVEVPNKNAVIELFCELRVSEELHKFNGLYGHTHNVEILELATFVRQRMSSLSTAQLALGHLERVLGSFRRFAFNKGWEDFEMVDLAGNLKASLAIHKNLLKGIEIETKIEGDTVLSGLPDELSQVWFNLIQNAATALQGSGRITICIDGTADHLKIHFEDTGGGIEAPAGTDVFAPRSTSSGDTGVGIGLEIVHQIIHKHDGTIRWFNTNDGAAFEILLPRNLTAP